MISNDLWKIPFNDLRPAIADQRKDIDEAIKRVLDNGVFINGPEVTAFEQELAAYCGVKYAVSCANGTDAIILALLRYQYNTSKRIMTVANSAPATVAAIKRAGFTPTFADIDGRGLMDLEKEWPFDTVGGTVFVNLYGQVVEYDINEKPGDWNNFIIEDGAQSLGTKRFCKSGADIWTTSFYPTKNLGALGDGGAVLTNDETTAKEIKILKNYGLVEGQMLAQNGFNSRLDEIQAAILRVRLKNLDVNCNERRALARFYDLALDPMVKHRSYNANENYHLYTIMAPRGRREELRKYLTDNGIQTIVHYPMSVNHNLPNTEYSQKHILSLPLWPGMKRAEVAYVAGVVNDFLYA